MQYNYFFTLVFLQAIMVEIPQHHDLDICQVNGSFAIGKSAA